MRDIIDPRDGQPATMLGPEDVGTILEDVECPRCKNTQLRFDFHLIADPLGEQPGVFCEHPGCDFVEWGVPIHD